MERRTQYGIFLLLFLIAGLSIYGLLHQFYGAARVIIPADIHITAPALTTAFNNDEGLADSLYLYKTVSVKGILQQLLDSGPGDITARLAGNRDDSSIVDCHLDSLYNRDDLSLRAGDSITIRGTFAGGWPNITLVRCIIEK